MQYLYNAQIHTLDPHQPSADAILIRDGIIQAVGREAEQMAEGLPKTDRVNLEGKTVWPGLVDAHIHLQNYSLGLQHVDCETTTRQECLARVAQRVKQSAAGEWVRGHGWNQNQWKESFGNAALLDEAAPGNPVYLTAKSLHAGWANSAALALAGITDETPDPADGVIQRGSDGQPTGILFESAMTLLEACIPAPSGEAIYQAIRQAQEILWQMGLTGVHDFDRRVCFSTLQILNQRGELYLRVVKGIPEEDLPHAVGLGLRTGYGDDFLRIGSVKLFADGALGPQTAAMLGPYEGNPDQYGLAFLDREQIYEIGCQASQNGMSLAIHAIGDRANHEAISGLKQLRQFEKQNGIIGLRHRIEHVQLLHPDDLDGLAAHHIIASMQPLHAPSDMWMAERHWGKRSRYAYAWNSLLARGTILAFGSDAPVESPNPFLGLHAAVSRCRVDGSPGNDGWIPEEKIHLEQALHAYTIGAAYAAGMENKSGRLKAGYLADLLVLAEDPFKRPASELASMKPAATMINGQWVWKNF